MQPVRGLAQAPAYESRRTDPAPDVFTCGTLGTPHHEWMRSRHLSAATKLLVLRSRIAPCRRVW